MEQISPSSPEPAEDEQLSIKKVFALICGGWRTIASVSVMFVLIAVVVWTTATPTYDVFYVAMPAPTANDPTRNGGMNFSVLGQQSKSPEWEMYLSLVESTALAQRVINTTPILQLLYKDQWDAKNKLWVTKTNFWSQSITGKLRWLLGRRELATPDKFSLQGYIAHEVNLSQVPQTTQYRIQINSPDPKTSLLLLSEIHRAANDMVRESRLKQAIGQRANLLKELENTQISDYRQTLLGLLGRVETNVMTASIPGQYAAIVLDGPTSGPYPNFPKGKLMVELAIVAGIGIGLIMVIFFPVSDASLLAAWRKFRRRKK